MIIILGIKHDLQFEQGNINRIAAETQQGNSEKYLPFLKALILNKKIKIAGEEGAIGLILNEYIKSCFGCEKTFLQKTIDNTDVNYFQFDLPKEQLSSYGIKPILEDILKKKNLVSREDREKWFYKIISQKASREENCLIIVGADHMNSLAKTLTDNGYGVEQIDVRKLPWYKDPYEAAMNNFFNT